MDPRRPPLAGPEQHYQRPPPSAPPSSDHSLPPSQQPYPPPRPQSLPGVEALHASHPPPPHPHPHLPPAHQYPGPPPPPALLHPSSHPEAQERPEHAYTAPPAAHGPIIKTDQPPAPPPFQRPSSNPSQHHHPHPPPGTPANSRPPMEHPPTAYAPHPQPPPGEHVAYVATPIIDHYGPQPHPGYYPFMHPTMHMANPNTRKKSMRASQACDRCRERKSKCDEQRPCSTCKDQNLECIYKDTHPTKADKNNQALSDMVERVLSYVEDLSKRMSALEKNLKSSETPRSTRVDTPTVQTSDSKGTESVPRRDSIEDRYELGEHTTAAHKLLLRWPSIHPFMENKKINVQDNYVMKGEDRGLLRLYGIGERTTDDRVAIGAASPAQSANSDEFIPSPPDANGLDSYSSEPRRSEPFAAGSPVMAMDADTVGHLFNSYKKHIHILHPFVDTDSLGKYLREFIRRHCVETKYPHSPLFATNGSGERDAKRRKRSDGYAVGLLPSDYPNNSPGQPQKRAPDRTLINAIVYLVLALGRVCEHGDPVPGPVQEFSAPLGKHGANHVMTASPISKPSPSSPRQSFNNVANTSAGVARAQSWDGPGKRAFEEKQAQNVDKIPGLAYYREACSILGDFSDSNELACAQARLLAGLYKGQLARVQESWSWINMAARTCLYRLKLDGLENSNPLVNEARPRQTFNKNENLTLLAYWTCLQLESDILAEWDYPGSGLSNVESTVSYPSNVIPEEDPQMMTMSQNFDAINMYYSAQLFLRKRLNDIHASLYGTKLSTVDPKVLVTRLSNQDFLLDQWRAINSQNMISWTDEEPPASDILAARLRGKYYGARYIATRPYLDYALHVMPEIEHGRSLEQLTLDANGCQRDNELALFAAIQHHSSPDLIKWKCRICVESAMQSTVAFDGVINFSNRLVVTNIMGTAHAQFGNMLVLAAVYSCKIDWLKELVPKEKLQRLLSRTIKFIRRLQHASSIARSDVLILETVDRKLFPFSQTEDDGYNNGSFESEQNTGESFTS